LTKYKFVIFEQHCFSLSSFFT